MSYSKDDIGNRMKEYEKMEAGRKFMPRLPVYARIDGRCFSKFTKGMNRPYDERMSQAMISTTCALVEHTNAKVGYTQSDEISLVWYAPEPNSEIFFDGRIQKMTSQLAALATAFFTREVAKHWPEKLEGNNPPTFDARVFTLPNVVEATNCILWREMDATKNSISMAAHSVFGHKVLLNKTGNEKLDMLLTKGINWNDYPSFFKRGVYVKRVSHEIEMTASQLSAIPAKHRPANNKVVRTRVVPINLPPLTRVENREGVLFNDEDPKST